jgi:uncharacterized protein YndB with AHSA1/START domain
MDRPSFVYKTYIRATPETLWRGLTEPEFTRRYWGLELLSDWRVGSTITWVMRDLTIADSEQVVLESDPYRRLAYTWHTMTAEMADSIGIEGEVRERAMSESRSKVTFDLEELGDVVKLTVTHDGFDDDSVVAGMVSEGWPQVVSELKTLIETGEALTITRRQRLSRSA